MKTTQIESSFKKHQETITSIAEGLWNGTVVSAVLALSTFLINKYWLFLF